MKKAVVVGIDSYRINPLDGCENDAKTIETILSSSSFNYHVKALYNEKATRKNFQEAIKWALEDSEFSILYFAGHGKKSDISSYLQTVDAEDDEDGIDVDWISRAIEKLSQADQSVLILLDCCHAGAMQKPSSQHSNYLKASDLHSPAGNGRVLMAACRDTENSYEYIDPQGAKCGKFSYFLSLALKGYAASESGSITISAVYDYVSSQFQEETKQKPVFKGDHAGVMTLAEGVNRIGGWRPTNYGDTLPLEAALLLAEEYLARIRVALVSESHKEWEAKGYLSACKTYEPIRKWFIRVTEQQPALTKDQKFGALYRNFQQYGKQLGTITTGTIISQGEIGDSLGTGTFGTVFKISEGIGETKKCFKVFHANDLLDKEKLGRFRRGYDAMKQMEHPNIVKVTEFSEVPYGFFMDYIPGPNARQYLPGITTDPQQIVHLLLQVAETLNHAHGKKVVHRDVKPENILIAISNSGEASAYLTDFDLAWFSTATRVTKVSEGFGSQFYAAPEQMTHPNSPAARSVKVDIYSFGQLCFFFLTGRDPGFNTETNIKVLRTSLGQYWTNPNEVQLLLDLYSSATSTDQSKRPADFRDICELLAKVELAVTTTSKELELLELIRRLQFTLSGDLPQINNPSVTTFRSRSRATDITIYSVTDNPSFASLDITFRPDDLFLNGMRSQDARQVILHRLDTAMNPYSAKHGLKRSGAKSGQFEVTFRLENIAKTTDGVLRVREIAAKIIDTLEGG